MKNFKRIFVVLILIFTCSLAFAKESVEVLFTHDVHSHLDPFKYGKNADGEPNDVGGFARLSTLVKNFRKENPNLLLLDAGDFSMGTLYQTVFETVAPELKSFSLLGYDATTFGNHEFDFGDEAIVNMYTTLKKDRKGESVVPLIKQANADFSESAINSLDLPPYIIFNKNDIKIAVFALMGKDSVLFTPKTDTKFLDLEESARSMVAYLKEHEHPDMIIALSHTGTSDNIKESEDEQLALNVDGIDLIISGHTHTTLETPRVHNNTTIVSCGSYGTYLGRVVLERENKGEAWHYSEYHLYPINNEIPEDEETEAFLSSYRNSINEEYLKDFGVKADAVVMHTPFTFATEHDTWNYKIKETNLGNFLSDALLYMYNDAPGTTKKADVAVLPVGLIRDTFHKGDVTVSDVFTVNSLGKGPDGRTGYPICAFYLTGKELKYAAEVAVSVSPFMSAANLQFSGLRFKANSKRLIMNKVYEVEVLENGEWHKIENKKLYKVVTDLYSLEMINTVTSMTKGLISFVIKDESGNVVSDIESTVVHLENGSEMKGWVAPIEYAKSFEKGENGVPEVSLSMESTDGRRTFISSFAPSTLFKAWNKIAVIICCVVIFLILLLALLVWLIVRAVRKRRHRG